MTLKTLDDVYWEKGDKFSFYFNDDYSRVIGYRANSARFCNKIKNCVGQQFLLQGRRWYDVSKVTYHGNGLFTAGATTIEELKIAIERREGNV